MRPSLLLPAISSFLLLSVAGCGGPAAEDAVPEAANVQSPATVAPAAAGSVPERFRGRWEADAAACAGAPTEMRLVVEPGSLRFHESVATVEAARPADGDAVALDLAFQGEGESWRETRTLRLLADGRLEVEIGGERAARVRCAPQAH